MKQQKRQRDFISTEYFSKYLRWSSTSYNLYTGTHKIHEIHNKCRLKSPINSV